MNAKVRKSWILIRVWSKLSISSFLRQIREKRGFHSLLTVSAILFSALLYLFFLRIFSYLASLPDLTQPFVLGFLHRLLTVFLSGLGILTFISACLNALTLLFSERWLQFLALQPLSWDYHLFLRTIRTYIQSIYMILLVLLPIYIALDQTYGGSWFFFLKQCIFTLFFFLLIVLIGEAVVIILVRYIPTKRMHQILLSLMGVVTLLFLVYIRYLRPERLVQPIETDILQQLLEFMELPGMDYYPSSWFAELLLPSYISNKGTLVTRPLFWILLGGIFLLFYLSRTLYPSSWVRAQGQMSRLRPFRKLPSISRSISISRWFWHQQMWYFARDPSQWGQAFLLGSILFLYFFNLRYLHIPFTLGTYVVWVLNICMGGFILVALGARFVLPGYSIDRGSLWLFYTLPVKPKHIFFVRWGFYAFFFLLCTYAMTLGSLYFLGLTRGWFIGFNMIFTTLFTLWIVSLGMYLAIRERSSSRENPLQVALSTEGLLYMIGSIGWLILHVAGMLPLIWYRLRYELWGKPIPVWSVFLFVGGIIIQSMSIVWLISQGVRQSQLPYYEDTS